MHRTSLFVLFIILVVILPVSHAKENILIVTEEWPPYNYSEKGNITGFSTEIVQNILKVINKNYKIKILPSMRSTYTLNNRPHTIMFSLFRTPERETRYKWIGPLCNGSIFFYKRRDNKIKIKSLKDIKQVKRIACRQDGLIPNILKKKGFKNLDRTATTSLQIYKKLIARRCDLAISDTDLGVRYYLKQLNADPDLFEKIPIEIFESDLYIACSKDIHDEEVQKWQHALEELKTEGLYEHILQKYN